MTVRSTERKVAASPRRRADLGPTTIGPKRVLPVLDVMVLQVGTMLAYATARFLGQPMWWTAMGTAAGLMLVFPVHGRSAPRWAAARIRFWRLRRQRSRGFDRGIAAWAPFDSEQSDGRQVGFNWDGTVLTSLIRIEENPRAMTVLEPHTTVSGEVVSMQMLADCLQQYDMALDTIDVISKGARCAGNSYVTAVYDAVLGPLPAVAQRSVWVAIRMDPTRCRDAIRGYGGDWSGLLHGAATATQRVANRLSDSGLQVRVATAVEMVHAVNDLTGGYDVCGLDETWRGCQGGRSHMRSYAVAASECTTEGLGALWALPSLSTTVVVSVRRGDDGDRIRLRSLVRFDGRGRVNVRGNGLDPLVGRQYEALVSALPLPAPRQRLGDWGTAETTQTLADLFVPASGCGQVIGADEFGRAIALPLFGPRIALVELCGTLRLAQQVILRSLALGARVLVHTRRAAAWRAMAQHVGDQGLLQVTNPNRVPVDVTSNRDYSIEMFDGVPMKPVRVGVTTAVLRPVGSVPGSDADVWLHLIDPERDTVQVMTRGGSAMVTMVATDDEMRFIGTSLEIAD